MKKKYKKLKICVLKQNESYFIRACFKKHALYIMKKQKKRERNTVCVFKQNESSFMRRNTKKTKFVYLNKINFTL